MQKERFPKNPWPIHTRSRIPYSNDWKSSRGRSLSTMGCSCGWRSHSPFDNTRIPPLSEQMVASFKKNKSNTVPLKHRSDFKQALSTLQQLQQKAREDFHGFNTFLLQTDRVQLTAVCCNRRGGVNTTPQMTRFRDANMCNNWLQFKKWRSQNTIWQEIQKRTTKSRKKEICTWYYVCVVKPNTTSTTTWPPRPRTPSTQRTWTLTREWAVLLIVSQVLVAMIHTLHRMAQRCCACHLIHAWSVRFSFDLETSIPFNFHIFPFILQTPALPPALLPLPWGP